jgi:hypothetical protein
MTPESRKSFVTYYLQNLSERTRRERTGTKWGIDWIAYNIGLARFGKPVRLPFMRHGAEGYPKSKSEAEFGVDAAFLSDDGSNLVIFVLKDEPLTNRTWTGNDFLRDLQLASTPDLRSDGLEGVTKVTIILAYNKDDQQNGIEAYERFVAVAPSKIADRVDLAFVRWNLSELVDQTIRYVLSPSLLPERFFGQLSYLAAQVADFRHGSDEWEDQLIPNWKRFLDDVLREIDGTRGLELIPVALIILREHAAANPSRETGWIDLVEWVAIAFWRAARQYPQKSYRDAVQRFWSELYISELDRFYRAQIDALAVENSIDQLASATSVGAVAASQVTYWHLARIGLLSLDAAERDASGGDAGRRNLRLQETANWLAMVANANVSVLRPMLDVEHIQLFLVFEAFRNAGRLREMAALVSNLETRLYLRRAGRGTLPFLSGTDSLEAVFEEVAGKRSEGATSSSSYFVLALLEMCCAFEPDLRNELLGRIHRHLVLDAADVGEPGDRVPLDLVSWLPPEDWAHRVLEGPVHDGEGVAVHQFGNTRDVPGSEVFQRIESAVAQMRKADSLRLPTDLPLAPLVLAALRHRTPLPPEFWRRAAFPPDSGPAQTLRVR